MNLYANQLYHVYNQGNNRRLIFFSDENYQYFLWKMKMYITPFADIIAYCLMPNHFHWLIYVHRDLIERKSLRLHVDSTERQRRQVKFENVFSGIYADRWEKSNDHSKISINEAIGILQRSYTRAINKEYGWTGSLFRANCKSKNGWIDEFITLKKNNGETDFRFTAGNDYAYACFKYIHDNPKVSGLVQESLAWKYSSAREYAGLETRSICNMEMGRKIMGW